MAISKAKRGSSSDVLKLRPNIDGLADELPAGYKCYTKVLTLDGDEAISEVEITDKVTVDGAEYFNIVLTGNQTLGLDIPYSIRYRDFVWISKVVNNSISPAYLKEDRIDLRVYAAGIL